MAKPHNHELRPFKAAHLFGIRWTEEEQAKRLGRLAFVAYEKHPGFSGFCDGAFVAAAGIIIPYPGLGEAWAIAGPLVRSHPIFFHKHISRILEQVAREQKLHRLQAMVREEFAMSHAWVTRLGFKKEAVLHKYGIKGEDMVVYVRFFNVD